MQEKGSMEASVEMENYDYNVQDGSYISNFCGGFVNSFEKVQLKRSMCLSKAL